MAKIPIKDFVDSVMSKKSQVSPSKDAPASGSDNTGQSTLDDTAQGEMPPYVEEEPTPASIPKSAAKKSLPPFAVPAAFWLATALFLLLAIVNLPSVTSLALFVAAALVCPLKVVRNLGPISRLEGLIPTQVPAKAGMAALAALLAVLGISVTPERGGYTLSTYLDLRSVEISQPEPIEYALRSWDVTDLISTSDPNVTISAQDSVNAAIVGTQVLAVDIAEGPYQKTEDVSFVVQDTQPPVIALTTSDRSYSLGESIDLVACFTVEDPIDGRLTQVEERPKAHGTNVGLEQFYDAGWFTVDDNDVDLEKPGTYQVIVTASDQHGNEDKGSFSVTILDPLEGAELTPSTSVLEYSLKKTDATKLVTCSIDGVDISATELDLSKVGAQTVVYTLTKGPSTKTINVAYTVKDTKSPTITIADSNPVITEGDSFDPYGNVSLVNDPVDGELERVEAKPSNDGNGWYTIEGDYDASKEGVYFLTVVACDKNGNQTTKEFMLTVNEAPKPVAEVVQEEAAQPVDNAKDYVVNTNTGRFHKPSCRYVKEIYDHNRWDVHMDRQELIDDGYEPCKVCKP